MTRYLLYDAGCIVCTDLTQSIERETAGWLTARSLHAPDMQMLLTRARPDWQWEPTLLEVEGEHIRVFTGVSLRAKLLTGLGLRRTLRVAQLVYQAGKTQHQTSATRRKFLKQSGAVIGGVLLGLGWERHPANAQAAANPDKRTANVAYLTGTALQNTVQQVRKNADVTLLWNTLLAEGFTPKTEQAQAATIIVSGIDGRPESLILSVPFSAADGRTADLKYAAAHGRAVQIGIGSLVRENGTPKRIDIREVVAGRATPTGTVVINSDKSLTVLGSNGATVKTLPARASTQPPPNTIQPLVSGDCNVCQQVFGYFTAISCGVTGFFVCTGACAAIGGPTCPIICAVVLAIYCQYGTNVTVETVCRNFC